ncbi:SWI/SNF- matrix-associated actin-dependent regulator of chromatin subfamily A-like protein 1 [Glugoides intestinalis]
MDKKCTDKESKEKTNEQPLKELFNQIKRPETSENTSKSTYEQLLWRNINKTQEVLYKAQETPIGMPTKLNNVHKIHEKETNQQVKVKVSLSKDFRVLVKPSQKVVATVLSMFPGANYDVKANEWSFSIDHYEEAIKELQKNKVQFEKIPAGTIALARKKFESRRYALQGGIYDNLMDFQREAVHFAINRSGRVLLADDMGLGKTIQALAIASYYQLEYPLLILAPASLCSNWQEAVKQFLGEEAYIAREKADFYNRIVVVSYSLAVNFIEAIVSSRFGIVVCDECHYLKSMTSKRTKSLLPILQKSARLIMISGTPATSRPLELYPILCALDKGLYPSFQVYGNRYCDGRKIGQYFDYRGCSNAVELSAVIEKALMIRRLKEEVLSQLPKKFRRQVLLDTHGKGIQAKAEEFIGESPDAQIMQEYAKAAIIKKEPVLKYLEEIVHRNVKCLVFAHHREMLESVEKFFIDQGVKCVRIDGNTIAGKRQALVEQFQNDESVRAAVLSLTACSTGLTLTAGKAVIFAELYWNPGTMLQAEDRIHRIGQNENVDIHYLVARNTIDEIVWPKLLKKLTVLESLGIGKNELKTVKKADVGEAINERLNFKRS